VICASIGFAAPNCGAADWEIGTGGCADIAAGKEAIAEPQRTQKLKCDSYAAPQF